MDTILKDSQPPRYAVRRTHRTYSAQFKAELVAASCQPGASIAALALQHGMNANVLHRWRKEWAQGLHRPQEATPSASALPQTPAFIPIAVGTTVPACQPHPPATDQREGSICIELQHASTSITVHWPVAAASECAQMLQGLLQ